MVFALRGGSFVEPPFVAQPLSLIGLTIMMFLFGPFSGFALEVVAMAVLFTWVYVNAARNIWGRSCFTCS